MPEMSSLELGRCLLIQRYCEEELQEHIDKLHEYNEIKDVGQLIIGKLGYQMFFSSIK